MGSETRAVIEMLVVASGSLRQGSVVFRYPNVEDHSNKDSLDNFFGVKIAEDFRYQGRNVVRVDNDKLAGCSNEALASLLSPQDDFCSRPFKLQINSAIFVGYPLKVDAFRSMVLARSVGSKTPIVIRTVNVVFVLRCDSSTTVIESFCDLARQLCIAIVTEEIRCRYLSSRFHANNSFNRMSLESDHDSTESDQVIAAKLQAKQEEFFDNMIKIFDLARTTGVVNHHFNNLIHISWILWHGGFVELKPWFSILMVVTDEKIICASLPDLSFQFLKLMHCAIHPVKTLAQIACDMCIPLEDLFNLVRHLHAWKKCVIIYPLAFSNLYGIQGAMSISDADQFSEDFSGDSVTLSAALAFFSPIARLADFLEFLCGDTSKCYQMIIWLIKHRLVVQYHQFIYVTDPDLLVLAKDPSRFEQFSKRIEAVAAGTTTKEERETVSRLLPYLDGNHSVDEIVFREPEIPRQNIFYIIDKFASVFTSSYQPDPIITKQYF